MHRPLVFSCSSLLVVTIALWSGCKGSPATGTGGSGATTTSTTITIGVGGAGGGGCAGPMPDGKCQPNLGEGCACVDCAVTALCNPGQCAGTMGCDHMLDSCTCPDCAEDAFCGDPTLGNCNDGGACDPYVEGCHCPNCWSYPACQASVAACAGGKPDGKCDRTQEDCKCVDCQGTPLCVPCQNTGSCIPNEPCTCADCAHTLLCNDLAKCVDDGVCAILTEGCVCNDCKGLPECAPWVGGADGGLDAGDAGG